MAHIKDEQDFWEVDKPRLILYADIMGFKDTVIKTSHVNLKKRLLNFRKAFEQKIAPLKFGNHLRYVQFSDSIIIVVNGVDSKMVNLITKAGIILMHTALKMKFPLKGVLAQGVFTYDTKDELYFGKPLVDAAILHDDIYFYGIVVHHSAERTIKVNISKDCPYCNSRVSLKKGKTAHYHLAWNMSNITLSPGDITETANKWLQDIQEQVSGPPRIYIDNTLDLLNIDRESIQAFDENQLESQTTGYIIT